jgi:hypothetical protein
MSRSRTSARPSGRRDALTRRLPLLLIAAAYLTVFPFFPGLRNPNEAVRVWSTRALALHGTFAIDAVEREWGEVSDRAVSHERRVSSKAPGTSLLGVPVAWIQAKALAIAGRPPPGEAATTWALRVFAVALPMLAFYAFFSRELGRAGVPAFPRDLIVVGVALGTMLYPYGVLFVGHALAAASAMSAFLLVRRANARAAELAGAGALAAAAVWCEYQAAFAAAAIAAFALVRHRRAGLWVLAGAAPLAAGLGAYHAALFGGPLTLPYARLAEEGYQTFHHGEGFLGFTRPRLAALAAELASTDYGLFVFSPFLAAGAVVGIVTFVRGADREARREVAVALAIALAVLLFVSGMANWRGGWCAGGPRYAATAVPFLAWPLALAHGAFTARRWLAIALAALVVTSVVLCASSAVVFPHYPLQFDNPVFQVAWRLLREGFAPGGLGRALGLPGAVAVAPTAAAIAGALAIALRSSPRPGRSAAAACAVAAVLLGALALVGPANEWTGREQERAFASVRRIALGNP